MLEKNEEFRLAKRWVEDGDTAAAEKMVTSHLRLVAKIAMGYRGYGGLLSKWGRRLRRKNSSSTYAG